MTVRPWLRSTTAAGAARSAWSARLRASCVPASPTTSQRPGPTQSAATSPAGSPETESAAADTGNPSARPSAPASAAVDRYAATSFTVAGKRSASVTGPALEVPGCRSSADRWAKTGTLLALATETLPLRIVEHRLRHAHGDVLAG